MTKTIEQPKRVDAVRDNVVRNVLNNLGTPPGYYQTKATNVYDNRWRVDIWTTVQQSNLGCIAKTIITDSFFVVADEKGNVVSPIIEKKY
jgi:hypothetical protein